MDSICFMTISFNFLEVEAFQLCLSGHIVQGTWSMLYAKAQPHKESWDGLCREGSTFG